MLPDELMTRKDAEHITATILPTLYPDTNIQTWEIVDFYYEKLAGWYIAVLLNNNTTIIFCVPPYSQPNTIIEETIEEFTDYENYNFTSPEEWTQSIFDTFLDNMES